MKRRAVVSFLLCICLLSCCSCSKEEKFSLVTDSSSTPICIFGDGVQCYADEYSAYSLYVLNEAVGIIREKYNYSEKQALDCIYTSKLSIKTVAKTEEITALSEVGKEFFGEDNAAFAVAVTAKGGKLTSAYSTTGEIVNTYAGSTIKPLSVYAPCIDAGIMKWSDKMSDSPVKKLDSEYGSEDWPVNFSGKYSYEQVNVADALAQSLNTVAVRWLQEYGVEKALNFLSDSFSINVEKEKTILSFSSEDEILGNVALGYLQAGVSVCDIAGCYRIFSDDGIYSGVYTIDEITDADGNEIYKHEATEKRVISSESATLMNRLLSEVIYNGTGKAAAVQGLDMIGKTGTSDSNADNWFVGVTPENTVAILHGLSETTTSNRASEIFPLIVSKANLYTGEQFQLNENVVYKVYCTECGGLADEDCSTIAGGYFKTTELPDICTCNTGEEG